jgi:hypothetical protein
MSRGVHLSLTPAQARMVNSALARWEADDHESEYRQRVMDATRRKVWDAMVKAGVNP